MLVCVVISSIGKDGSLRRLLESLAIQTEKRFEVGICDQSTSGVVSIIAEEFRGRLTIFLARSSRGLSRGRNAVIKGASSDATHYFFPNDTSTVGPSFIAELYRWHYDTDVLALSYVNGGQPRYSFPTGSYPLTMDNVWNIIEPGMVLSRRAMELAGNFDEKLGTGCETPWQSGEGTDLLLRLVGSDLVTRWDPEICVNGVSQDYGLTTRERRSKLRSYGRGYGFVLSRWKYPLRKRAKILFGPFNQLLIRRGDFNLLDAIYSSLGRAEGLAGGVMQVPTEGQGKLSTS